MKYSARLNTCKGCRNHKLRNVLDELPEEQQGQTLNLMRAAWKVATAEEGEKRLEQLGAFSRT